MKINLPENLPFAALDRIFDNLKPSECWLVGGVVREALLGNTATDIDIATTATPEQVQQALNKAKIQNIPTGIEHGTITAVIDHQSFEITTLRTDSDHTGRHATVNFTTELKHDAERRDLTFNAIYSDLEGNLTDFFNGVDDLNNGVVKFIGNPQDRMHEDHLRILRYFRFFARFGKAADQDLLNQIGEVAHWLRDISDERISMEIVKLLSTKNPAPVWHIMDLLGVTEECELHGGNAPALMAHVEMFPEVCDPKERLCALFGLYADWMVGQSRLMLSNKDKKFIDKVAAAIKITDRAVVNAHKQKTLLGDAFAPTFRIFAAYAEVDKDEIVKKMMLESLAEGEAFTPPEFPLGGTDIMELGIPAGEDIGRLLEKVRLWWMDNDFPSKEYCLNYLKEQQ